MLISTPTPTPAALPACGPQQVASCQALARDLCTPDQPGMPVCWRSRPGPQGSVTRLLRAVDAVEARLAGWAPATWSLLAEHAAPTPSRDAARDRAQTCGRLAGRQALISYTEAMVANRTPADQPAGSEQAVRDALLAALTADLLPGDDHDELCRPLVESLSRC